MAELASLLPTTEFIISERSEVVSAAMIAQAPLLKMISRLGSLPVGIDLDAARAAKVHLSMQPVHNTMRVAEHVLMMALAVTKRLGRSLWLANQADYDLPAKRTDEDTFSFNWLKLPDIGTLSGKRIAILGMGEIGIEFARRIAPFRPAEVLYHKRVQYPAVIEHSLAIRYGTLLDCVQRAEILVVLLPYAAETDRLLNAEMLAKMPRGAYLIAAGSGSVIDEQALIDALKSGQLAGAALDTYEYEPLPPDHPLLIIARDPFSNLLLTPHTAGASGNGTFDEDYGEIMRYLAGEPLRYGLS